MGDILPTIRAAVVQATPVLFDRDATIEKALALIAEASGAGAQLVVFPEAFVPAYPRGLAFGTTVGSRKEIGRELWLRYWSNSVDVPGGDADRIAQAARDSNVHVAIGVVEREGDHGRGTLYCTTLYFGPDGSLLGKHRKLKPTAAERFIWGEGDGSTLTAVNTPFGVVGGLTCWENYMPLARYAMYAKGVDIYVAPTADSRDTWQSTVRHIACEGRCFVLGCNQFVTKSDYPADIEERELLTDAPEILCPGGSTIISPLGEVLAGPLWDQEGTLYADLDMADVARSKLDFDAVGHYARPDIFDLRVDERRRDPVVFEVAKDA